MPEYKLTYFETTGIVEVIRLILHQSGEKFEDVRVPLEKWNELKKNMPFERLPVIEIDGVSYHQSLAIARYLAKQYDLDGENDKGNLEIDGIVETINDLRTCFTQVLWCEDPKYKNKIKKKLQEQMLPFYFNKFSEIIKKNDGYLWRNKLTWADLAFIGILPYMSTTLGLEHNMDILDDYDILREYVTRISEIPKISEWLNNRPEKCAVRELLSLSTNGCIFKS